MQIVHLDFLEGLPAPFPEAHNALQHFWLVGHRREDELPVGLLLAQPNLDRTVQALLMVFELVHRLNVTHEQLNGGGEKIINIKNIILIIFKFYFEFKNNFINNL
jgi:hypothetical protein